MEVTTIMSQATYSALEAVFTPIVQYVNDKYDLSSTVEELYTLQHVSNRSSSLPPLKPRTNTRKSPKPDTPVKICKAMKTTKEGVKAPCTFKARGGGDFCGKHSNAKSRVVDEKRGEEEQAQAEEEMEEENTPRMSIRRHNDEVSILEGIPMCKDIAIDNEDNNLVRGRIDDSGELIPSITDVQKTELTRHGFSIENVTVEPLKAPTPVSGLKIKAELKPKAPIKPPPPKEDEPEEDDFWPDGNEIEPDDVDEE